MAQGVIFNIQRFSVHDGPGIRTTVFFKGCPLDCWWCHNPEGKSSGRDLMFWRTRCVGCGKCVSICPAQALGFVDGEDRPLCSDDRALPGEVRRRYPMLDRSLCLLCGQCVAACPARARELAGMSVTSEDVMRQILRDRPFYDQSDGGVTFSGGEPVAQPDFLLELLARCADEGIHTAVDTSGYAPWETMERVAQRAGMFLYDLKIMDDERHVLYTGVSNSVILDNLRRLAALGARVIARIPLIPGINDDDQNIEMSGRFLRDTGISQVHVLPYHAIAIEKYNRLSQPYRLAHLPEPEEGVIGRAVRLLQRYGLHVKVGG